MPTKSILTICITLIAMSFVFLIGCPDSGGGEPTPPSNIVLDFNDRALPTAGSDGTLLGIIEGGIWAWGLPTGTAPHDGKCYGTNLSGNYSSGMNDNDHYFKIGPIDLSCYTGEPQLKFKKWLDLHNSSDSAKVEVSTNQGISYSSLSMEGYDENDNVWYSDSNTNGWGDAATSLEVYSGESEVYIRFSLASGGSGEATGFYVDDIEIGVFTEE